MKHVDVAIVGAGVMGLAHAYHASRAGLSVAVFERNPRACGASVRNFGMLAVVAQAPGRQLEAAKRALGCWQNIAAKAGISLEQVGCLFLARQPEEMAVLEECASLDSGHEMRIVVDSDLAEYAPNLCDGVLGGLWSADAWKVDQRTAMDKIADWLYRDSKVVFHFSSDVKSIDAPFLETDSDRYRADHIILCGGEEFTALFPDEFRRTGVSRCQLQMMRTRPQPPGWRIRPFILGGLSMTRYSVFAECPSLTALIEKQRQAQAACLAHGIHVIACQENDGSVTIGDSHAYGDAPQRSDEIDRLIMDDLAGMIALPETRIAARWLGQYAHLPGTDCLMVPIGAGVTAVTMTNGQGMTHALAVAEDVITDIIGATP